MPNQTRTLIATAATVTVFAFTGADAAALCVTPEAHLQGTIPADGASNVPLDTGFVFFSALQPLQVMVNDISLTREGQIWSAPQALDPETPYELTIRYQEPGESTDWYELTQTFTTGTELAPGTPPPMPSVVQVGDGTPTADPGNWSACERYANSVGCPDTEDPVWVKFEIEPSSAAGWVITSGDPQVEFDTNWPASCSTDILWRGYVVGDCFDVTAIDTAGRLSEPLEYCVEDIDLRPWENPDTPDTGMDGGVDAGDQTPDAGSRQDDTGGGQDKDSSTCSAASGPTGSPLWLALFSLLILRRRPRRPFSI